MIEFNDDMFVLIPFGLFGHSAFMAERVLGNVISSGIKVLVLAVIIGIGSTLFGEFTAGFGGASPTIDQAMAIVLAALSLLGLGIFGQRIASGIVSGGPQLSAGAAVGTGLGGSAATQPAQRADWRGGNGCTVRTAAAASTPPPRGAPQQPTASRRPDSPARPASRRVSAVWPVRPAVRPPLRCAAPQPARPTRCAAAIRKAHAPRSRPRAAARAWEPSAAPATRRPPLRRPRNPPPGRGA